MQITIFTVLEFTKHTASVGGHGTLFVNKTAVEQIRYYNIIILLEGYISEYLAFTNLTSEHLRYIRTDML